MFSKERQRKNAFNLTSVLILPAQLSRYYASTLGFLIHLPSKKNLWNLQMAHPDPNPMWKFPVFLNHAEKTIQPGSFKDICLLRLETKKNKPNPSLQINLSKLKACGNVYWCVLYSLVENIWGRRDLTDHPTPTPEAEIEITASGLELNPEWKNHAF